MRRMWLGREVVAAGLPPFLQVNKKKLLIGSFSLFPCLFVSMRFETLVEVKIEIESRVRCINIYDNHCTLAKISTYNTHFRQYFQNIL